MENANPAVGHASESDYNHNGPQLDFDFDITIVDGEQGSLLAQLQAHSILEVLEWFSRQPFPPTSER